MLIQKTLLHIFSFIIIIAVFGVALKWSLRDLDRVQLKALDATRPDTFKYLCPKANLKYLDLYKNYFSHIENHFGPSIPEIEGLLGYCYYNKGDLNRAVAYYKLALKGNKDFFWYYYNLGIIYLRKNEFDEALNMFQKALSVSPNETLITILASTKVYLPIVHEYLSNTQEDLINQIKDGQQRAMQLAVLTKIRQENPLFPYTNDNLEISCY